MPSDLARHWTLDPGIVFLNHGSFGATPRAVLDAQAAWRERMEREPVAFFARDLEQLLDEARTALGRFVGANPAGLAFVTNATQGLNTVLRSLQLDAGDELLTTDHAYPAARNALDAVAAATGARVTVAEVPFPTTSAGEVCEAILGAITPRTRLAMLDHVTSATALVLPIGELIVALRDRGVETLVDGAHAPGMLPLDLDALGAAYYVGNAHKWMCAPKGAGFIHVRADVRDRVRPLVISHGSTSPRRDRSRYHLEHDWTGTADPSAWLSVPAAIGFGDELLPGGWAELRDRDHRLALKSRDLLARAVEVERPAPDAMLGAMTSVPLNGHETVPPPQGTYADPVHAALQRDGIQVALGTWPVSPGTRPWRRLVRVSVAPYVSLDDVELLANRLARITAGA